MLRRVVLSFASAMVAIGVFPDLFRSWLAAGVVPEGRDAFNDRDYARALQILRPVADYEIEDAYVARAQYIVGLIYKDGLAGEQSIEIARAYLERSRALGNEDSGRVLSMLDRGGRAS